MAVISSGPDDLRRYVGLVVDERSATEALQRWSAKIGRLETTILRGELILEKVRAAEHTSPGITRAKAPPTFGTEHPIKA
jgi:hypothetical protein